MEQSRLRVGDTLDDYCPRERRLTTHAVVALVEDRIKQTRCMTCDFEHAFKDAKIPARRKKPEPAAALSQQVVEAAPAPQIVAVVPKRLGPALVAEESLGPSGTAQPSPPVPIAASAREERPGLPQVRPAADTGVEDRGEVHEAAVHRRLIRATLPRQEGQAPTPRPIPEFTIRHASSANVHSRRSADAHRPASSKGKFRGDRGHFGSTRPTSGAPHRGGSHSQRFGKKGPR